MIDWTKIAQQRGFETDREMFIAFSKEKKTIGQIIKELKVSHFSIWKRLKMLGFKPGELFPRGGPNHTNHTKKNRKAKTGERVCRICGKPCWPNYFFCEDCHKNAIELIAKQQEEKHGNKFKN